MRSAHQFDDLRWDRVRSRRLGVEREGDGGFAGSDLAGALRRAAAAHGEHEKRTRACDENWPDWYSAYMVAEQSGAELPT